METRRAGETFAEWAWRRWPQAAAFIGIKRPTKPEPECPVMAAAGIAAPIAELMKDPGVEIRKGQAVAMDTKTGNVEPAVPVRMNEAVVHHARIPGPADGCVTLSWTLTRREAQIVRRLVKAGNHGKKFLEVLGTIMTQTLREHAAKLAAAKGTQRRRGKAKRAKGRRKKRCGS